MPRLQAVYINAQETDGGRIKRKCKTPGCDNVPSMKQFLCGPCKGQRYENTKQREQARKREAWERKNPGAKKYKPRRKHEEEAEPVLEPYPSAMAIYRKMVYQA